MNRERRHLIAKVVAENGSIKNEEIIERFGVSIETVRRDLDYLEKQGVIERVYGGAVRKNYHQTEPAYALRESKNSAEKRAIARACEELIGTNDTVFFDLGTTVLALANVLDANKKITAFTNALRTALVLTDKCASVIVSGGKVRPTELAVSGALALENMAEFNVDKAIIGAAGVNEDGISDFFEDEARIRRAVIDNAREVIVLCDSSKFNQRAMCKVCALDKITTLITDANAPERMIKAIKKAGVNVIIAK